MSAQATNAPTSAAPPTTSTVATVGLVISSLALAGWLFILFVIFTTPKAPPTGDPMGDVLIAPANGLMYLFQVLVGLVGLCVNGTLSLVGTLISAAGIGREPRRASQVGIGLGVVGMLIGAVMIVWRLAAWDML